MTFFTGLATGATAPFLKLDVQGYERTVLEGAAATIPALVGLQLETSVVELYDGETLFPTCWACWQSTPNRSGRPRRRISGRP